MTATKILALVGGGLAVLSFFKPEWHLIPVAVLLLAVGLFVSPK